MTEGKSPRWNALRLRGLRQRWIVNTVMPVLVLLILLMTLFSAGVQLLLPQYAKRPGKAGPGAGQRL